MYFTMDHLFPSKLPIRVGGCGLPSNVWFLGPIPVLSPNDISIGSAVFAGPTIVTDQPTTLLCLQQ